MSNLKIQKSSSDRVTSYIPLNINTSIENEEEHELMTSTSFKITPKINDEEDEGEDSLLLKREDAISTDEEMYLNERTISNLSKKPYVPHVPPHKMTPFQYAYYIFVQFMKFTWQEVSKRKVGYLIGTASCFVVVWKV